MEDFRKWLEEGILASEKECDKDDTERNSYWVSLGRNRAFKEVLEKLNELDES